jgi:hypothetical protein
VDRRGGAVERLQGPHPVLGPEHLDRGIGGQGHTGRAGADGLLTPLRALDEPDPLQPTVHVDIALGPQQPARVVDQRGDPALGRLDQQVADRRDRDRQGVLAAHGLHVGSREVR